MRREPLYLRDIIDAAEAVQRFLNNVAREDFLNDDLLGSAVLQKLIMIGEAAARLPTNFRDRHPDIDWIDIVAFRNIAIHAYFSIDWGIVWTTATQDVPALKQKISAILSEDVPSEPANPQGEGTQ